MIQESPNRPINQYKSVLLLENRTEPSSKQASNLHRLVSVGNLFGMLHTRCIGNHQVGQKHGSTRPHNVGWSTINHLDHRAVQRRAVSYREDYDEIKREQWKDRQERTRKY